jgi:hypothetical protein
MGPAARSPRTGHLFAYLALSFMTRGDLHDRRSGGRNSETYGLSFCLSTSVGPQSIVVTTTKPTAEIGSRDRGSPWFS